MKTRFLGRGTCTPMKSSTQPSRAVAPTPCSISIDRRTHDRRRDLQSCLKEIEDLPACKKYAKDVKVSMYMYDRPAWTGHVYETECFFPTWINKESAPHVGPSSTRTMRCGATRDSRPTRPQEKARRPPADRQVVSPRRLHPGPFHGIPVNRLPARRRVPGPCANRDHLEAGSVLRRALYRHSDALQEARGGKDGSATSFPSRTDPIMISK